MRLLMFIALLSTVLLPVGCSTGDHEALIVEKANAQASKPNPTTCEGYPERREFMESQSWWHDSENDFSGGDGGLTEHSHSAACFPLYRVVSGTLRLDVVSQLHNLPGRHARVRVQDGSRTLAQRDTATCDTADCTFVTRFDLNTANLATGTHELRLHTEARVKNSSGSVVEQNLATNSWQLCVRSCDPIRSTVVRWPQNEGRGWYDTPSIDTKGYINARVVSRLPLTTVSGNWCPTVRILKGAAEGSQDDTPVERSFASIDPNFHRRSPGRVILNQRGTFGGSSGARLCIDTTTLANGPHRLFMSAYSSSRFRGQLWGALVVPFKVAN